MQIRAGHAIITLVLIIAVLSQAALLTSGQTSSKMSIGPINLSHDGGRALYPNVQSVGQHVYVVWTEGGRGIKFRTSPDGGITWFPPINMPALTISSPGGTAQYPMMSANGSNVYIVWSQNLNPGVQLFFANS